MLKAGDRAPAFELTSDAGTTVKLSDFAGKKLVVFFYPKDNTPGCTRESVAFSEALERFQKAGATVVGISRDSVKSHGSFRDKFSLRIPLLSDPERIAHHAFGAWGEKTMYGKKVEGAIRSTFVIDDGVVTNVFPNVRVDGHVDAVLGLFEGGEAKTAKPAAPKKAAAKKTATKKA